MGTLIVLGVIGLSGILGIVLISLLRMAKKTDQFYDRILCGEEMATPPALHYLPVSEIGPPASGGEARTQRDLNASAAAL